MLDMEPVRFEWNLFLMGAILLVESTVLIL